MHSKLNSEGETIYKDAFMGISAEDVDTILDRFFGSTVAHETPENSRYWIYENGDFLMPAADGESYGDFSIATNMNKRPDGNYVVNFNVYRDESITGGESHGMKDFAALSPEEANKMHRYIGSGKAILKDKVYYGNETYELVAYEVNYNF